MDPNNQQLGYTPQAPQTPPVQPQNSTPQMPVQPQTPIPQQVSAQTTTSKKKPILLIIIICAIIAAGAVAAVIVIPKLSPNTRTQDSSDNDSANTVKGIAYSELASVTENPQKSGLYKIGDEYVYKGKDEFEVDEKYKKIMKGYVNNFVKLNDHYWRILRINSDGSMKLIFVGGLDDKGKYYNDLEFSSYLSKDKKDGVTSYEDSQYREKLNTTFLNNTKYIPSNYKDFLAKGKVDISIYELHDLIDTPTDGVVISDFEDYVMPLSTREFLDTSLDHEGQAKGYRLENWITSSISTNGSEKLSSDTTSTCTSNLIYSKDTKKEGDLYHVIELGVSNGEYRKDVNYNNFTYSILPVITVKSDIGIKSGSGSFDDPFILDIK